MTLDDIFLINAASPGVHLMIKFGMNDIYGKSYVAYPAHGGINGD